MHAEISSTWQCWALYTCSFERPVLWDCKEHFLDLSCIWSPERTWGLGSPFLIHFWHMLPWPCQQLLHLFLCHCTSKYKNHSITQWSWNSLSISLSTKQVNGQVTRALWNVQPLELEVACSTLTMAVKLRNILTPVIRLIYYLGTSYPHLTHISHIFLSYFCIIPIFPLLHQCKYCIDISLLSIIFLQAGQWIFFLCQ